MVMMGVGVCGCGSVKDMARALVFMPLTEYKPASSFSRSLVPIWFSPLLRKWSSLYSIPAPGPGRQHHGVF
jgi:hypothetical protein